MAPQHPVLFARQPIFDGAQSIVAYELLYRASETGGGDHHDGDAASSRVLVNAFNEMAIEDVLGDKPAFINFTPQLIINPPPFSPDKLVIEVLETVQLTDELLAGIHKLKDAGFRIALDDFRRGISIDGLLSVADIVKLDVLDLRGDELEQHLEYLRGYPARLLAEKIESHEMYDHCVNLGFDMYQGFFLCRPQVIKGRRAGESQQTLLRLLQQVNRAEVEVPELARTVAADPILSYKLLRLVNSAMYRPVTPIETLQHAVSFLGLQRTRSWIVLLSLSNLGEKPPALTLATLVRARFCEGLARHGSGVEPERCFTAGMLSMLDAYFDQPLDEVIATLQPSPDLQATILHHEGLPGLLLATVIHFERADWDRVDWQRLEAAGIDKSSAEDAYLDAVKWADEIMLSYAEMPD